MRLGAIPLLLGTVLWLLSPAAFADWTSSSEPLAVKVSPNGSEEIIQNPPSFSWSRHPSLPGPFELELIAPDGRHTLVPISRNWYLPDRLMALGNWAWRVRPQGSTAWSDLRHFSLSANARPFVVPELSVLKTRVLQHPRPRSLPAMAGGVAAQREQAYAQRPEALAKLREQVLQRMQLDQISDSDFEKAAPSNQGKAIQAGKVYGRVTEICQQAESAALLYVLTNDETFLREAIRRAEDLALLNPGGPTSYSQDDQTTRRVAMSLAQIADQLNTQLPTALRTKMWNSVRLRGQSIYADLDRGNGQLEQYPLDSHASVALNYLAALATLGLGEMPEAERWFDYAVRYNFHYVWPWAGVEGGYANGTAYAAYAVYDALRTWPLLHNATGVNLFAKPWAEGLVNYFAWFVPPGTPSHLFGDAAETDPGAWLLKAFASRVRTPVAKWYARNLIGDEEPWMKLQAPYPIPVEEVATAKPPSNTAWIRSIGWVAMHSDMADRGRTSVYFKSSGFGSYNHSHASQNSFVITSAGRALLTDSGVYDSYGSPHWTGWYRRTEAHNAVTFDGGQGQLSNGTTEASAAANGKILSASFSTPIYRVDGDATKAYTGALSMAQRTLWYIPEHNWVIIRDKLASPSPRVFELNFHAPAHFIANESGYRTDVNKVAACIDVLTPQMMESGKFKSGYLVPPNVQNPPAAFSIRIPTARSTTKAEIWTAIRIGCEGTPIEPIAVNDKTVQITNGPVSFTIEQ